MSGALIVGSPLLSYHDVWLPGFLLNGLTCGEARHQGPKIVREGSLEPIGDGSGDTVFQGRAVHILVEAPRRQHSYCPKPSRGDGSKA